MPSSLADHAFISNSRGAALVDRSGCIDWLCLPQFDSAACFAALLGTEEHGCWSLAPAGGPRQPESLHSEQRYRQDTLVVDCDMETSAGRVRVSDCMPIDPDCAEVVRVVRGLTGRVPMRMLFRPRFGYGAQVPRIQARGGAWVATAGETAVALDASVPLHVEGSDIIADFEIGAGDCVTFAMTLADGCPPPDPPLDPQAALDSCERWWRDWMNRCEYDGPWRGAVSRSLLTLKGLIYDPTGGIIAAPTTSLPEIVGGVRNWDYRYCWLRDAAFTLLALLGNGYRDEAEKWRDWLVDAVRRDPFTMHVLYRIDCGIEVPERELDWLPGYRGSRPVRVGNAANEQFQLDTRGEVMDVLHIGRQNGLHLADDAWDLQVALLEELERRWREADHGIWEMRGNTAHFVHSKVLAWVAFDRGVCAARDRCSAERAEHWSRICGDIREDVMRHGFDGERGIFVQRYGAGDLDASLLLLPLVGFVAADSPEAIATVDAIRADLTVDGGLLRRYRNDIGLDGLPGHEGAFLPCSFWLVDNLALSGRVDQARKLFEHLLTLCNHVGLMTEEWDTARGEMLGNIPQALSHVGLLNSARILSDIERRSRKPPQAARPERRAGQDGATGTRRARRTVERHQHTPSLSEDST
ncbi:MAG: glycoside hydrolase family 15 protein [Proteobacteria bacterium]|nr:glycoside hydrolase family 15 protein [Pseudomonadota bacterium]